MKGYALNFLAEKCNDYNEKITSRSTRRFLEHIIFRSQLANLIFFLKPFEAIRHKLNTSRIIHYAMDNQPHPRTPKRAIREFKKTLREKGTDRKHIHQREDGTNREPKPFATEKEISDGTLKQLHTLGNQRFGSSPFSLHFNRWLTDVAIVLNEFESNHNIAIDDQYAKERSQILAIIKQQLEDRCNNEVLLDQEMKSLSGSTKNLEKIHLEYVSVIRAIKTQKNREVRRMNRMVDSLKKEQEKVIQMKTGFFRGISRKDREQREIAIAQELDAKEREFEMAVLDFNAKQKKVLEEYERKREPVLEQVKKLKKISQNLETDGSLEERWFACEALVDSIITFLQRKATQPTLGPS